MREEMTAPASALLHWKVVDTEKGGRCMVYFDGKPAFAVTKSMSNRVANALNFHDAHLAAGSGEGWVSVPVEVWAECLEVISEAAGGWDRQARQLDKKLTAAQYENKP